MSFIGRREGAGRVAGRPFLFFLHFPPLIPASSFSANFVFSFPPSFLFVFHFLASLRSGEVRFLNSSFLNLMEGKGNGGRGGIRGVDTISPPHPFSLPPNHPPSPFGDAGDLHFAGWERERNEKNILNLFVFLCGEGVVRQSGGLMGNGSRGGIRGVDTISPPHPFSPPHNHPPSPFRNAEDFAGWERPEEEKERKENIKKKQKIAVPSPLALPKKLKQKVRDAKQRASKWTKIILKPLWFFLYVAKMRWEDVKFLGSLRWKQNTHHPPLLFSHPHPRPPPFAPSLPT